MDDMSGASNLRPVFAHGKHFLRYQADESHTVLFLPFQQKSLQAFRSLQIPIL